MEILFEILLFLAEFVLEFFLNMIFEGVTEVGAHKVKKARQKKYDARVEKARAEGLELPEEPEEVEVISSVFIYSGLGVLFGVLSVFVFPTSFIKNQNARLAYLLLAPLAAGMMMSMVGRVRNKRGEEPVRLDNFAFAFLFAFCMAGIRYLFSQ